MKNPSKALRKNLIVAETGVAPKGSHKAPEHHLQTRCVTWFRYEYPELADLLFAVPNGGARNSRTGKSLKAEGVLAGVSDLILLVPNKEFHALCIEMKTMDGEQTAPQITWQQAVSRMGYKYSVARSFEGFQYLVNGYLPEEMKYKGIAEKFWLEDGKNDSVDVEFIEDTPAALNAPKEQGVEYHRKPTKAEVDNGDGGMHFRRFPLDVVMGEDGQLRKWLVADDGLRYYR